MYLFDSRQQVRAAIVDGITACVHHEHTHTLDAAIPAAYAPRPGEYLGFLCVDKRWRLFCITEAELDDTTATYQIEATDAAVDDLQHVVVQNKLQQDVTASTAASALLEGTGWVLGNVTTGEEKKTTDAQWVSLWTALETLAEIFDARVTPYYVIEGGEIAAKKLDMEPDEAVFRGRIYESQADAHNVRVTYTQRPITVLYGLGKATETESDESAEDGEKKNTNFADVVWSKANGDPADKPAGQLWVEDAEATALYGRRENIYTANDIEDPAELLKDTWEELQKRKAPKATITGTIQDMEQLAEEDWRKVRLGDLVVMVTQEDAALETRVIKIDRDYVQPDKTKLTTGEELQTATSQIAGLVRANQHTQETITIYRNKFHHDKSLILLNADLIMQQGKEIDLHATNLINLSAGQKKTEEGLDALNTTFTVEADGIRQSIQEGDKVIASLKSTVDGLEHWVTDTDGNISTLTNTVRGMESKVETADGRVSSLTNTAEGLTKTITEQGVELAGFRVRADEINSTVRDINGNVGSLSVKSDSVTAKVKAAGDQISALAVTADGISATITKQGEEMSSLKVRLDEISQRVKDNDGNVGSLVVRSDRVTAKLEDATGKIKALTETTDEHFASLQGDIYEVDGTVKTIVGSSIWQTRDNITAAVGKMYVDANGKLHIRDGSGLVVDEGSSSMGVYTEGNLTAGVLVQKLNDGTTSTKIKADVIQLDGKTIAGILDGNSINADGFTAKDAYITSIETDFATSGQVNTEKLLVASEMYYNGEEVATQDWVSSRYIPLANLTTLANQRWVGENFQLKSGLTTKTYTVVTNVDYNTATTPPFFNDKGTQVSSGITYVKGITKTTQDITVVVYV